LQLKETEPAELPTDIDACHSMIAELKALIENKEGELKNRDADISYLKQRLQEFLREKYGRSTEKVSPEQLILFKEQIAQMFGLVDEAKSDEDKEEEGKAKQRRRRRKSEEVEVVIESDHTRRGRERITFRKKRSWCANVVATEK
jgi:hypothetical protein